MKSAWWNGALTIVEILFLGFFFKAIWMHDFDALFFNGFMIMVVTAPWLITLLEMNNK
jgi:ABC-type iron transport system FetAB permease component